MSVDGPSPSTDRESAASVDPEEDASSSEELAKCLVCGSKPRANRGAVERSLQNRALLKYSRVDVDLLHTSKTREYLSNARAAHADGEVHGQRRPESSAEVMPVDTAHMAENAGRPGGEVLEGGPGPSTAVQLPDVSPNPWVRICRDLGISGPGVVPLKGKQLYATSPVLSCTPCIDDWREIGGGTKKTGARQVGNAFTRWIARCTGARSKAADPRDTPRVCNICEELPVEKRPAEWVRARGVGVRGSFRCDALLQLQSAPLGIQLAFCRKLATSTGIDSEISEECARGLFERAGSVHICASHRNTVVKALDYAIRVSGVLNGQAGGMCALSGVGCAGGGGIGEPGLRRLPFLDVGKEEEAEQFFEYEDSICFLTSGRASMTSTRGRFVCRPCMYFITSGASSNQDQNRKLSASLPSSIRLVVTAVSLALGLDGGAADEDHMTVSAQTAGISQGRVSFGKILNPSPSSPSGIGPTAASLGFQDSVLTVRPENAPSAKAGHGGSRRSADLLLLPVPVVVKACRQRLEACSDGRTAFNRLVPALGSIGVVLHRVSYKGRMFCGAKQLSSFTAANVAAGLSSLGGASALHPFEAGRLLGEMAKRFKERRDQYWKGDFELAEEIGAAPLELWQYYCIPQVSTSRTNRARITAAELDVPLVEVFPFVNSQADVESALLALSGDVRTVPPNPGTASGSRDTATAPADEGDTRGPSTKLAWGSSDGVLVLRTWKVIEQAVFARSKSVAGPLTAQTSIAGMLEYSLSWSAVINKLGISASPDSVLRYRNQLIAQRKESALGSFYDSPGMLKHHTLHAQFDNINQKGMHATRSFGKEAPILNGFAAQAYTRPSRPEMVAAAAEPGAAQWKEPTFVFPNRTNFAKSYTTPPFSEFVKDMRHLFVGAVFNKRRELNPGAVQATTVGDASFALGSEPIESMPSEDLKPLGFEEYFLALLKPHGGASADDPRVTDTNFVFVDISPDNAAHMLTIRRKLSELAALVRPGTAGRPRFVVVCGDQPTYHMLCTIWTESFKNDGTIHSWLVPMPGLFHVEKVCMHSLCKEMIDGLGLQELCGVSGFSKSVTENFLSHGNARNNRRFITNVAVSTVAMLIHRVEDECGDVWDKIKRLENSRVPRGDKEVPGGARTRGPIYQKVTEAVDDTTFDIGELLCETFGSRFASGSVNGSHFIETFLFGSAIPALAFHACARTGHTDVTDALWFSMNNILFSSGHTKYMDLSLMYRLLRGIMPRIVVSDVYDNLPGLLTTRIPSFTSGTSSGYDKRGWTYMHSDESLESLIIRMVKSMLYHDEEMLENVVAWLLQFGQARVRMRALTGAGRIYSTAMTGSRAADDAGATTEARVTPQSMKRRSGSQYMTVARMFEEMLYRGFLDVRHRGLERLTNVFSVPERQIPSMEAQERILNLEKIGQLSAELHASSKLPHLFGPLSAEDFRTHFKGVKLGPGKWTRKRMVPTAGAAMRAAEPAVKQARRGRLTVSTAGKAKAAWASKILLRQNRIFSAMQSTDIDMTDAIRKELGERGKHIWRSRHLVTAAALAYRSEAAPHRTQHATKSSLTQSAISSTPGAGPSYLDFVLPAADIGTIVSSGPYTPGECQHLMFDMMNLVHHCGSDGSMGTSLGDLIAHKLTRHLSKFLVGSRGKAVKSVHLHGDDRTIVLSQKSGEQAARDAVRLGSTVGGASGGVPRPNLEEDFLADWSTLLHDRALKCDIVSAHLLIGAQVIEKMREEEGLAPVRIVLYGGNFRVSANAYMRRAGELQAEFIGANHGDGLCIYPNPKPTMSGSETAGIGVPVRRTVPLVFETEGYVQKGLQSGSIELAHGEAETRLVASFKYYVLDWAQKSNFNVRTVFISSDTDVFIILVNSCVVGRGCLQVLGSKTIDIDVAVERLGRAHVSARDLAETYVMAGCDFSPPTVGVGQEKYLRALIEMGSVLQKGAAANLQRNHHDCVELEVDDQPQADREDSNLQDLRQVAECDDEVMTCPWKGLFPDSAASLVYGDARNESDPNIGGDFSITTSNSNTGSSTDLWSALRPSQPQATPSPSDSNLEGSLKEDTLSAYEVLVCNAFLTRYNAGRTITQTEFAKKRRELEAQVRACQVDRKQMNKELRGLFKCDEKFGSKEWIAEARGHIFDSVTSAARCVPHRRMILHQVRRAIVIVRQYWEQAERPSLLPAEIGGVGGFSGFNADGSFVLETEDDIRIIEKEQNDVAKACKCKTGRGADGKCCTGGICYCRKSGVHCVGCGCDPSICGNGFATPSESVIPTDAPTQQAGGAEFHGPIPGNDSLQPMGDPVALDDDEDSESSHDSESEHSDRNSADGHADALLDIPMTYTD